ncbi:MAG: hypothetical protein ACYSP9_00435 [Planctomycetota bacterium]|jgi:hypothetical protein
MKSRKNIQVVFSQILLIALLAALQGELPAQAREEQWDVLRSQIPESYKHYSVALQYTPSRSTFHSASRDDSQSTALAEAEQIDGYKEHIDFGTAADGYRYSVLLRGAPELRLINRDGRQIHRARMLRSRHNETSEIVVEGYFFLGNQFEIPFELASHELALPTDETIPGTFSVNIYSHHPYSYRGSLRTRLRGSLTGSTFTEEADLKVSLSYRESIQPKNASVNLALEPFDKEVPRDSASGKITDVLKLRSAKIVVEKIATDSSEIVLAVMDGDLKQALTEQPHLSVGEPVPDFARVDLIRRQLLTLEDFCTTAGRKGWVVLIFGDLKRQPVDRHRRGQETMGLPLDETVMLEILRKDLQTPPVVVFVSRQFFLSDLYERWLGQEPDFYIISDYSNPMDLRFWFPFRQDSYHRPSGKIETLRKQLVLPENKASILLANGEGDLVYIDVDAGQRLEKSLTQINRLMKGSRSSKE